MSSRIATEVTKLLGIRVPIIAAPMAGASGGELAAQVSKAGGFGFIGAGYNDVETLKDQLSTASSILRATDGAGDSAPHSSADDVNIGVGFFGWKLDKSEGHASELLRIALDAKVKAIWLSFGARLGHWTQCVRRMEADLNALRATPHTTLIFVLINSVEDAKAAAWDWKADVVVAQGIEAGGHGHGHAPPLLELVPETLEVFKKRRSPPLIAAGGLATGAHIASVLTLGAAGVVLGTRFLATPESLYTHAQKQMLLTANSIESLRTRAFDIARGTLDWPAGIDGRALYNQTVRLVDDGKPIDEVREFFNQSVRKQDPAGMLVFAGAGVGLIHEIKPAADVLSELTTDTLKHLQSGCALVTEVAK